jgi:DNA-binding NarL/FixJ family response regulator
VKQRVLWIEDSAHHENTILAVPVYLSGKYDLQIALNATDGMLALQKHDFDAIVVDIRLPPGDDARWIDLFYNLGRSGKAARLGLRLLRLALGEASSDWSVLFPSTARDAAKYGILTVESWNDIAGEATSLGVANYSEKGGSDPRALLSLIERILSNRFKGAE